MRCRSQCPVAVREQVLGALPVQRHPHGARDAGIDRLADQVVTDRDLLPGADEEIGGDALGDPAAQLPGRIAFEQRGSVADAERPAPDRDEAHQRLGGRADPAQPRADRGDERRGHHHVARIFR